MPVVTSRHSRPIGSSIESHQYTRIINNPLSEYHYTISLGNTMEDSEQQMLDWKLRRNHLDAYGVVPTTESLRRRLVKPNIYECPTIRDRVADCGRPLDRLPNSLVPVNLLRAQYRRPRGQYEYLVRGNCDYLYNQY